MVSTGSPKTVGTKNSSLERHEVCLPIRSLFVTAVRVWCHYLTNTDSATVSLWAHYGSVYKWEVV